MSRREVVLLSGGMDSTVLTYARARVATVLAVSFRYGQRHALMELAAACRTVHRLGIAHVVVEMPHLGGSALTDDLPLPEVPTSDAAGSGPVVVPGRNLALLSVAAAMAHSWGAARVYFAGHGDDAAAFPDCRPGFIHALANTLTVAGVGVELLAPFLGLRKSDVVARGNALGVRWEETYSCYAGGAHHCGRCGACRARFAAIGDR